MAVPLDIEKITICLEQKVLFMTSIYNTTKQIEVKSRQEEIQFQDVLNERANSISRIDKCDSLIAQTIAESDDEQAISIVKDILASHDETVIGEIPEEYAKIAKLAAEYRKMLAGAVKLDTIAVKATRERHAEVKNKLKKLRNPANHQRMFNM